MTSKVDPSLSIEKLQSMPEGQYYDRKSARPAEKDFAGIFLPWLMQTAA